MQIPTNFNHKMKNETLALMHGIYAGLMVVSGVIVAYLEMLQPTIAQANLILVYFFLLVLIALNILAHFKVKQGQGRTLSRIMALLMLLSFPIGTVLGIIALWKSTNKQWNT